MRVVAESQINGRFRGWHRDAVFLLANGQAWKQDRYAYHYHYAYRPKAIVFEQGGQYVLRVENMDTDVPVRRIQVVSAGNLRGSFHGWGRRDMTFHLDNGTKWRQVQYQYEYRYEYRPEAVLYQDRGVYMLHVDGMSSDIEVRRA